MGVRKKGVSAALEAFKFAIFLSMPVATVVYFNTPDALVRVIEHKRYIEFPVSSLPGNFLRSTCLGCAFGRRSQKVLERRPLFFFTYHMWPSVAGLVLSGRANRTSENERCREASAFKRLQRRVGRRAVSVLSGLSQTASPSRMAITLFCVQPTTSIYLQCHTGAD